MPDLVLCNQRHLTHESAPHAHAKADLLVVVYKHHATMAALPKRIIKETERLMAEPWVPLDDRILLSS